MTIQELAPRNFNNHSAFGLPDPPLTNNESYAVNVRTLKSEIAKVASPSGGVNLGNNYTRSTTPPANPSIGDYWDEITTGGILLFEWFWNGIYWLSRANPQHAASTRTTLSAGSGTISTGTISFPIMPNTDIFIDSWGISGAMGGTGTTSANYCNFEPRVIIAGTQTTIPGVTPKDINKNLSPTSSVYVVIPSINAHYVVGDGNNLVSGISGIANRFGSFPGIQTYIMFFNYRYARK